MDADAGANLTLRITMLMKLECYLPVRCKSKNFMLVSKEIETSFAIYIFTAVGYLSASIRSVADARVGDTITHHNRKAEGPLPGYQEATPMVFCGLFPVDADQFPELRDALEKLQLNDASLKVNSKSDMLNL
ncbi:Translation factor GUF1-like protein chloroplastic [Bienertia sinuspersici]